MFKKIDKYDKEIFISLAKEFYSSSAVLHPIPDNHFSHTFKELTSSNTYAECFLFYSNSIEIGYALIAKTFSQEAGGLVLWIEELYVKPEFQGKGIATKFIKFLEKTKPNNVKRIRLEVEPDNGDAIALYKKLGFEPLKYKQYVKDYK